MRRISTTVLIHYEQLVLGFLYEAFRVRRGGILEADHGLERKLKEAYDATRNLIESRRCVAVIKRSRTRALGAGSPINKRNGISWWICWTSKSWLF
jgi:hypothetical protein